MSSQHGREKAPLLIRPLVLKLPIDFHHGWLWTSDQPEFSASTKAKLSHLEARSAFRDPHSPLTSAANLFPSGRTFFWGGSCRISTQWFGCWLSWRAISYFHQLLLSLGVEPFASLKFTLDKKQWVVVFCNRLLLLFEQMYLPNVTKKLQNFTRFALKKQVVLNPIMLHYAALKRDHLYFKDGWFWAERFVPTKMQKVQIPPLLWTANQLLCQSQTGKIIAKSCSMGTFLFLWQTNAPGGKQNKGTRPY